MVQKALLLKIYEAASMQRWNDQIRTVELTELDKQAHKMIIAYVLGKCEEDAGTKDFDWLEIIEGGLFEFLQRIILTDLKPPLFHRIKQNRQKYRKLNEWVYDRVESTITPLGRDFCRRFKSYLLDTTRRNVNRRVISAAHFYATKWEFRIIERANPRGYLIDDIRRDLESKEEKYHDLQSMQEFLGSSRLKDFVDICGQLRFQIRWSHLHRVPKTSVLGHMLIVAMLAYLFSLELKTSARRKFNNYFTGLFHDLPEVLTRDIINPVKGAVQGLDGLIRGYEREEMTKKIYKLIPQKWASQMRMFTEDEFSNLKFRDGSLIKGVDKLTAFLESYLALQNGAQSQDLKDARQTLAANYKGKIISGIDFGRLYAEFH